MKENLIMRAIASIICLSAGAFLVCTTGCTEAHRDNLSQGATTVGTQFTNAPSRFVDGVKNGGQDTNSDGSSSDDSSN